MAESEYLQREEAAKKQLGAKGVKKRVKQLPTAARASLREMTGVDISRKGVSVDPFGVAMALPVGKVLKAAKVLRAAGNVARADALTTRVVAKAAGGSRAAARGQREQKVIAFMRPEWPGVFSKQLGSSPLEAGKKARGVSESVFPRLPNTNIPGSRRSFDVYEDPLLEGAGRFRGQDDLNKFVSDMGKLGKFRKVGKAAEAAKKRGGR